MMAHWDQKLVCPYDLTPAYNIGVMFLLHATGGKTLHGSPNSNRTSQPMWQKQSQVCWGRSTSAATQPLLGAVSLSGGCLNSPTSTISTRATTWSGSTHLGLSFSLKIYAAQEFLAKPPSSWIHYHRTVTEKLKASWSSKPRSKVNMFAFTTLKEENGNIPGDKNLELVLSWTTVHETGLAHDKYFTNVKWKHTHTQK